MTRKPTLKVRLQDLVADMVKKGIRLHEAHEQLERQFLSEVLSVSEGNQSRAAQTPQYAPSQAPPSRPPLIGASAREPTPNRRRERLVGRLTGAGIMLGLAVI